MLKNRTANIQLELDIAKFLFCLCYFQNVITEIVRRTTNNFILKMFTGYKDSLYNIEKINKNKTKKYFIRGIYALYLFRQIKNKTP
jgi:hypothetical protein